MNHFNLYFFDIHTNESVATKQWDFVPRVYDFILLEDKRIFVVCGVLFWERKETNDDKNPGIIVYVKKIY